MNWHPISFTGWSVKQILAHLKTQTRRLIRLTKAGKDFKSPFGVKGDMLWVRESFVAGYALNEFTGVPDWQNEDAYRAWYRATDDLPYWMDCDGKKNPVPWKPPMFMPRWASRITLVNEGERIERVQRITREDALMEGVGGAGLQKILGTSTIHAQDTFRDLWDSINGKKPGGAWAENPRCRVLSFRLVEGEA